MLPLLVALVTQAITPTPTPTKTDLNEDIQKIREAVQEKVKEKIKEITTTANPKKGFVGTITQVKDNTVSIDTAATNQTLNVTNDTVIIDSKRNKAKLSDLKPGLEIVAMGILDDKNELDTKRIVFVDLKSLQPKNIVASGKVADISKATSVLVLVPVNNKNTQYQIKTDSKTEYYSKDQLKISLVDIKAGQKIAAVLKIDPKNNKSYTAQIIINLDYVSPVSPTPTKKP